MTAIQTMVVVGAGLAGAKAVETLREEGFDGRVVLFGEEAERPYNRPPLSKEFLTGAKPRDSIYVHDEDWYPSHDVELRTGTRVMGLNLSAREVRTDAGERVTFDKLLLATGSSPRRINLPGADLEGVSYLRRAADSEALLAHDRRRRAAGRPGGRRLDRAGGGRRGPRLRQRGHHRREPAHRPAGGPRDRAGRGLRRAAPREGRTAAAPRRPPGDPGAHGRVTSVVTTSGQTLPADVVLIGMGADRTSSSPCRRASMWTTGSRSTPPCARPTLTCSRPATSPTCTPRRPVRGSGSSTGRPPSTAAPPRRAPCSAAGRVRPSPVLLHRPVRPRDGVLRFLGRDGYDRIVYRGDPSSREFIAFWLHSGRVVAGMNVNVWEVASAVQELIRSRAVVDVDALQDPMRPLDQVVAGGPGGAPIPA